MVFPTVLVVDDDDDIRDIAQLSLETTAGWRVLTAADGPAAVEIAGARHPDVVLLDMMMPGMDGLTTVDLLQSAASTEDIPVILFTAKLRIDDRPVTERAAIRGIISKPFDPMTLADEVSRILRWPSPAEADQSSD